MTETPMIQRVRELVDPIATDLDLDVYDIEQRGATLRVTLDTRPGNPGSIDLEQLSLATRLISRELDHTDPVPGKYTLEVTSPGVERSLRTPAHFQREIGKTISVRLANVEADQRRLEGLLVAADDSTATIRVESGRRARRPRDRDQRHRSCPHRVRVGPSTQTRQARRPQGRRSCQTAGGQAACECARRLGRSAPRIIP